VSSKVLFMENGYVIESGPSKEFFENPKEQRSREFVNTIIGDRG
jgi:cystine transport system ATP-binding protein/L-cystine transport system ATP-binding protein